MMEQLRMRKAMMVFDPVDGFVARRNIAGPHPRPIGTIAYRLLARRQAGLRSDLDPPLNLVTTGTPSGYDVWLGLVSAPRSGRHWADLENGDYIVEASSPLYQSLEVTVTVPLDQAPPSRFELEPGYGYPFPRTSTLSMGRGPILLRGTVHRNDGDTAALAGLTVEVPGQSSSSVAAFNAPSAQRDESQQLFTSRGYFPTLCPHCHVWAGEQMHDRDIEMLEIAYWPVGPMYPWLSRQALFI